MRLRFLDAARCLAIVMMVLAHVRDGLISPEGNASWLARLHDHTRGFTAPLFFVVAGWSFAQATLPRWPAFRAWGPPLRARLERIVLLFALGKLLTLPWWHEGFPLAVPGDVWLPFATSGVLECLALTLLVAHVWLLAAPRRLHAVGFTVLAAGAVLVGPWLQLVAGSWPLPLRGLFTAGGFSGGFPLAPTGAYFWLGAALGTVAVQRAWRPLQCALAAGSLGAALVATGWALGPGGAAYLLRQSGSALVVLAVLAVALEKTPQRPSLEPFAGRALTFYVGHMLVLWGVPFVPGLVFRAQHGLDTAEVACVTAAMLLVLSALCLTAEWASQRPESRRAAEG